jgi:hypothetical protein
MRGSPTAASIAEIGHRLARTAVLLARKGCPGRANRRQCRAVVSWGLGFAMQLTLTELMRKWRDQRRIVRKRLPRIRAADVILISYPKCGRTWLRVMMSHVYHLNYGTPLTRLLEFDNLHALVPRIPKISFENEMNLPSSLRRQLMNVLPSKKVILPHA